MKKAFNKIKTGLAIFGIAIISFFSKVFGESSFIGNGFSREEDTLYQPAYGVSNPIPYYNPIFTTKKIVQWVLVGAIFIIGIINFTKIKKTDDKTQKKKKIKRTIIILTILLVTIFLVQLIVRRIMGINAAY